VLCKFINESKPDFFEPYRDVWNEFATKFEKTKVISISKGRREKLLTRLKEKEFDFVKIMAKAAESTFLHDPERNWFDLDWLLSNDTNYIKVLEGKYMDKAGAKEIKLSRFDLARKKYRDQFGSALGYESSSIMTKITIDGKEALYSRVKDDDVGCFIQSVLEHQARGYSSEEACFKDLIETIERHKRALA
jgi:hypothetical protein